MGDDRRASINDIERGLKASIERIERSLVELTERKFAELDQKLSQRLDRLDEQADKAGARMQRVEELTDKSCTQLRAIQEALGEDREKERSGTVGISMQKKSRAQTKDSLHIDVPVGLLYHFFVSHAQHTGGDQCQSLCLELENDGFKVWYDQKAANLTTEGMRTGIMQSHSFILFLSDGVMSRQFVQLELREAHKHGKQIVLIHEEDSRHGKFDFGKEAASTPDDLKFVFDEFESIPYRRREWERRAMLTTVINKSGLAEEKERSEKAAQQGMASLPSGMPAARGGYLAPFKTGQVKDMVMARGGWKTTIVGQAGTGKSSLAAAIARSKEAREQFKIILWLTVTADAPVDSLQQTLGKQLLRQMATAGLSVASETAQLQQSAGFREQMLAALTAMCSEADVAPVLLILDGAMEKEQEHFCCCVDELSGGKVVITSRLRKVFGGKTFELDVLSESEAVTLLVRMGLGEWAPSADSAYSVLDPYIV
jgi:hypothetical protein